MITKIEDKNTPRQNILHLLRFSLPVISGYSIRSHFILKNQKQFANPYALTDPYFKKTDIKNYDIIENIIYYRYPQNYLTTLFYHSRLSSLFKTRKIYDYLYYDIMKRPKSFINEIVKKKDIKLIHGYSTERFANLGESVARKRKIPFIYELRGFYEETWVGSGILKTTDPKYKEIKIKETNLMLKADLVVTLGEMMKNTLIKRGIDKNKIHIVPNGVDMEYFQPLPKYEILLEKLKIEKKHVISYIGKIRRIEGIETLIKALSIVIKEVKECVLLLVGSIKDNYRISLEKLAKDLRISNYVRFIGEIPLEEIKKYYSITDLIVIPRIDSRVNRLVTPLKPLEAMAMNKVVITSDLPALKELVKPGISGDVFKADDPAELAKKILQYLTDKKLINQLTKSALNYVGENFSWSILAKRYQSIYEQLLS